jgi:hypothetical protein
MKPLIRICNLFPFDTFQWGDTLSLLNGDNSKTYKINTSVFFMIISVIKKIIYQYKDPKGSCSNSDLHLGNGLLGKE